MAGRSIFYKLPVAQAVSEALLRCKRAEVYERSELEFLDH